MRTARRKFEIILSADWLKNRVVGLDINRLVEIKGDVEGSGYLISSSLILTARHVVDSCIADDKAVQVRILKEYLAGNTELRSAKVIWPVTSSASELDAALLVTSEKTESVSAVSYLLTTDVGTVEVYVNGFPNAGIFTSDQTDVADTVGLRGWINTGSGIKQQALGVGSLEIVIREEDLLGRSLGSWSGMSGSPVFAGRHLLGVVTDATKVRDNHRLLALPVAHVLARDDVQEAIARAQLTPPTIGHHVGMMISGLVLDAKSRAPLDAVELSTDGASAIEDSISDARGRFTILLRPEIKRADLLWVYAKHKDYDLYREQVPVIPERPLIIEMKAVAEETAVPKIVYASPLKAQTGDRFGIEVTLKNPSKTAPAWVSKVELSSLVEQQADGYTGFLARSTYNVRLDYEGDGKLGGLATEAQDDEFGYPIFGSYKQGTDTRFRRARFWEAHIDIPVQLKIEPDDKLRLVLAFSKPSATLVKEENDGRALMLMLGNVRIEENRIKVVTPDDHTAERVFKGREFLVWLSQDITTSE